VKLFIAGEIVRPSQSSLNAASEEHRSALLEDYYAKESALFAAAETFGQENYPNYKDISAYWDDSRVNEMANAVKKTKIKEDIVNSRKILENPEVSR